MPRRAIISLMVLALLLAAGSAPLLKQEGGRLAAVDDAAPDIAAPTSTPAPTAAATETGPPRIAAPLGLHDRLAAAAARLPEEHRPVPVAAGGEAELVITLAAATDTDAPALRTWVAVAGAHRLDLSALPRAALVEAAAAGRLFAAEPHAKLLRALLPEAAVIGAVAADRLAAILDSGPGLLALVPLDGLTSGMRALALDGVNPAWGEGEAAAYPLVTRGRVVAAAGNAEAQALAAALTEALATLDPAPVRITFTGDIIPARCVYDRMRATGDWAAPFRATGARLAAAGITVGSLDAAISARAAPIGCRETFSLLAPPEATDGLRLAGFDVMTVATNHVKDCGAAGFCGDGPFLDTLAHLRAAGIAPAGGGRDELEARRPVVLTAGGVRFAFLGYDDVAPHVWAGAASPGTAGLDLTTLVEDIRAAREVADVVIVLPQWGEEYTPHPNARQREAARVAVEAGAALVAGNHPHVVQAAGPLDTGYVAYALGNFVFDQDWSTETMEGVVMETAWHGPRLAAVRFLPVRIEGRLQPVFLSEREGLPVLQRMMEAAARLTGGASAGRSGRR